MKKDIKISVLSIVSVLCATVVMPSFAASSVRSLGGAGTYNSASSAANAKSNAKSNSARAGSLRVGTDVSGSRVSSARGTSVPRLSIGKYLGGSSVISGGSSSRPIDPEQSGSGSGSTGDIGNLKDRVGALEQFVGYTENDVPIKNLVVDVEALQADLKDITGKMTQVVYQNGILTIVQDGETVADVELVTADDLQAAVDSIVIPSLDGYAKLTDIPSVDGFVTIDDLTEVEQGIAALQAADDAMNRAIEALRGGSLTEEVLNEKVDELSAVDVQLQAAIDELQTKIPADGVFAKLAYVDGLIAELKNADSELSSAIAAIKQPDVDKNYVDTALNGLNQAIDSLKTADADMAALIEQIGLKFANVATKDELGELRASIDGIVAGDLDLTNYYTKAEADVAFAVKSDLDALNGSIGKNTDLIAENTAAIANLDTAIKSAADEAKDASSVAQDALNMAGYNAEDIVNLQNAGYITSASLEPYAKTEDLADVAISGSYDDLLNAPTIPTSVDDLSGTDLLVTKNDLLVITQKLEDEIENRQIAGDYATAAALEQVSVRLETLRGNVYTKAQVDEIIAKAITNGEIDLTGYAKTEDLAAYAKVSALQEVEAALRELIETKVNKDELGELAYMDESELTIEAAQITSIDGGVINEGSITDVQLKNGSVTAEKLNTGNVTAGDMAMLVVGEGGQHSWVSVTVDQ